MKCKSHKGTENATYPTTFNWLVGFQPLTVVASPKIIPKILASYLFHALAFHAFRSRKTDTIKRQEAWLEKFLNFRGQKSTFFDCSPSDFGNPRRGSESVTASPSGLQTRFRIRGFIEAISAMDEGRTSEGDRGMCIFLECLFVYTNVEVLRPSRYNAEML